MKIGELFVALGFDVDDNKLQGFNDGIKDARNSLLKLSAVTAGTLAAVNAFILNSSQAATGLRNFQEETGHSMRGLQEWQQAVIRTNPAASIDTVTSSYRALAQSIADVTMGKGGGEFAMLGLPDVRNMDVSEVLERLRANFSKNVQEWGYKQTIDLMNQVGFDPAMVTTLKLTREEFERLIDGKILSREKIDRLHEYNVAWSQFMADWKLFMSEVAGENAPAVLDFLKKIIPVIKKVGSEVSETVKAYKSLWDSFSPATQKAILAFAAAIVVGLNPMLAVFAGLAWAIWEVGRALRGLPDSRILKMAEALSKISQKQAIWLGELFGADMSALKGSGKPALNYTPINWETAQSTMSGSSPANRLERMIRQNEINMNNVYNIHSIGDVFEVSNAVGRENQRLLNQATADQGNGGAY